MLTPENLHPYQQKAVVHQCTHPASMLWLDIGLGKTAVTLTSIAHLVKTGFLRAVVVVAPIRVCRLVWRQEAAKWSHLGALTFSMVMGTKDQRVRALLRPANIYVINYENLEWLSENLHTYFVRKGLPVPFDGIVYDEVDKMKNSSTNRVKALKKVLGQFKWSTGLTGTPASEGYKDLHGQYLVVDKGERLGTSKTAFRTRFYRKTGPYKEVPYDDAESAIKTLVSDITLEMSAADYNPLPDLIVNDVNVELTPDLRERYDQMEKEMFLKLDSGAEKEMFNQASLMNTCLQFSNGATYPVPGMPLWEPIHELKLNALEEIIEESNGQPIFCAYAYRSDAARIMERFKGIRPINLTECNTESSLNDAMRRWVSGDCTLMIAHPACLHPETKVLTQWRGWVNLIDVRLDDKVFDGVEFVSHSGCSYSGHKEVINVLGITMTPDHKLLIDGQWTRARYVRDSAEVRCQALRLRKEVEDRCPSEMHFVRGGVRNAPPKRDEKQQRGTEVLQSLHHQHFPPHDPHPVLGKVAGNEVAGKELLGQKLRWSWDRGVSRMAEVREFLQGYVLYIFGWIDPGEKRRKRSLLQAELCVDQYVRSAGKPEKDSQTGVPRRAVALGEVGQDHRDQQDHADDASEPRDVCGRSSGGRSSIPLRQESESIEYQPQRETAVYDLVNCGPRHRFVIRNDRGEAFISHNSAGHGIDGLQKRGNTVVWFGLNWSLRLYNQFNGRLRRQGQGRPVTCHRILCLDTVDQAQALALGEKAETEGSLRKAVKEYRKMRESA